MTLINCDPERKRKHCRGCAGDWIQMRSLRIIEKGFISENHFNQRYQQPALSATSVISNQRYQR
jgi:hypothetical protein